MIMKKIKIGALTLAVLLLFTSCGGGSFDSFKRHTDPATQNPSENPTEITTVPDTSPVQIEMSKSEILRIYTQAANKVKTEHPGFKRTAEKTLLEVRADTGYNAIIENIMRGIMNDILSDGSSVFESPMAIIPKGNSLGVKTYFPIFGESYGCGISGTDIISAAQCMKVGNTYELTLYFNDINNPEPGSGEFGRIMSPVRKTAIQDAAASHAATPGRDILTFETNYTNSYLKCAVDIETNRMLSLEQNMTINISVKAQISLFGITTNLYGGTGTIKYILIFSEFAW